MCIKNSDRPALTPYVMWCNCTLPSYFSFNKHVFKRFTSFVRHNGKIFEDGVQQRLILY